jgi:hypothetical protein
VNCGISALFPYEAQFLLHCRGEGGRGGDMGHGGPRKSLPFPKLTGLLRHFPPPSMCVAVLRGWRSYPRNKAAPHPGRNIARNRFGMTLMADISSPRFFKINKKKVLKSEGGALFRSYGNGGLKHSWIAMICPWRAPQFCFKRRTPLPT